MVDEFLIPYSRYLLTTKKNYKEDTIKGSKSDVQMELHSCAENYQDERIYECQVLFKIEDSVATYNYFIKIIVD